MNIHLTPNKIINLTSALSGVAGTLLLFFGSFAFEAPPVYMNQELVDEMACRNKRRTLQQRIGLLLLMFSFILQIVVQFVD